MHKSLKNIVVDIFNLPKLGEVLILPELGDMHDSHYFKFFAGIKPQKETQLTLKI